MKIQSTKNYILKKIRGNKNKFKGSLTIEAALIMPVFIFATLAFIYLLQVLILHNNLQDAITGIGLDSAKYGYVYETLSDYIDKSEHNNNDLSKKGEDGIIDSSLETFIAKSIDSVYFKTNLYTRLNPDSLNKSVVQNGFSGIHTYLSSFMDEDDEVDIILNYNIRIPLVFFNVSDFQVVQRVKLKSWNGYRPSPRFTTHYGDLEEQDEEIVFITQTGNVYHVTRNCSHISLSIRNVPYSQVKNLRNNSGGKYSSCNKCWSANATEGLVYITTSGDRYHGSKNCSGLKRTIIEVPISKVADRNKCKRCGK